MSRFDSWLSNGKLHFQSFTVAVRMLHDDRPAVAFEQVAGKKDPQWQDRFVGVRRGAEELRDGGDASSLAAEFYDEAPGPLEMELDLESPGRFVIKFSREG